MKKFLPLVLVLLVATVAFAQQNRGRIIGTVTTADGAVIVGATVTVASDALIAREMTTTTNERGMYRFVLLPVGTFNIRFEMEGYNTIEQTDIVLDYEVTVTLDKVMTPSEFERVVTITGEAPLVDKTDSGISRTLDFDYLLNAPNTRYVWGTANALGGFTDESAFGGVESAGQAYNQDGVNVSDPATGTVFSSINMEAVEQMDVAMFGSPAEYGAFTGATLNAVTKSGGNDFHGEVNYFMQRVGWVSDNTEDHPYVGAPTASDMKDPNFAVGGPVLQDRAWFFFNFNYQKVETQRGTLSGPITQAEDPKRSFLKVSMMWNDRNVSYFSWVYYKRGRSHRVAYGSWSTNWEDGLWEQVSKSDTYLLQHSYVLSDDVIIEGRFAGFRGGFDLVPRNEGETAYDLATGLYLAPGSLSRTDLYTRNRDNLLLTVQYYNDNWNGSHSFKFGIERESSLSARYYSHELVRYYTNGAPSEWYNYGTYEGGTVITRYAGFLQDSWSLSNRLTLNLGFRYDSTGLSAQNAADGGLGGSSTFLRYNDPAWRLGFAYDLFGDGTTVLRGFYGRYYEGVLSGNTEPMVTGVPPSMWYYWSGGAWVLGDVYGGSQPGEYEIDPTIGNQWTEGIMLGVERELMANLAGSVTFVYKWDGGKFGSIYPNITWTERSGSFSNANGSWSGVYYDGISYGTPEYYTNPREGQAGVLGDLYRHYWSVLFELTKRMSDNWSMVASYGYSRNTGTTQNNSYGVVQGFDLYNNPNWWINRDGRLGQDMPHQFKFSGTYIAPFDIYISPIITYRSGQPYGHYYRPAGASRNEQLIAPIDGSNRYGYQLNVDLRLEKAFIFMDRFRVGVIFDIFNLFNDDAITNVSSRLITSSAFERVSAIVRARYYQLGFRFLF